MSASRGIGTRCERVIPSYATAGRRSRFGAGNSRRAGQDLGARSVSRTVEVSPARAMPETRRPDVVLPMTSCVVMKTTPPRNGPDDTPRAEHERDAAWSHLSSADEEDYGLDPEYWPGGKVAEVAERLDEVIERAYVSDLKNLSPTDLLAALLVLRKLREDFTTAEGLLIETARKKNVTWARIAPALEVKSRQAAERRFQQLCGNALASHPGRTQQERVDNERDRRAEARAERQWIAEHADEVRHLARRLAAYPMLQQAADAAELAFHDRITKGVFPTPPASPARWPAQLQAALATGDTAKQFQLIRNATLPRLTGLAEQAPDLVADIKALYRAAGAAGLAVLRERWERREGPDPDEDADD